MTTETTETRTNAGGGRIWGAAGMVCLVFLGLAAAGLIGNSYTPSANVADAIAGEKGYEIARSVDPKSGSSLSIHYVNHEFVVLVSRDRPVGVTVRHTAGLTLCRALDAPATIAELHAALSEGMDSARLVSEYTVGTEDESVTVWFSGGRATVLLRSGRHAVPFTADADELWRLSGELADFIIVLLRVS